MTVKELIEELQKQEPDLEVVYAGRNGDTPIDEVTQENPDEGVVYVRLY